jgi:anti-anti-sigma factor
VSPIVTFDAASRRVGTRAVVRFDGELDYGCEGLARAEVEIALERGGDELVIDLRGLRFIDVRGVHVLLEARSACVARNQRIVVTPTTARVRRTFELCHVDGLLRSELAVPA